MSLHAKAERPEPPTWADVHDVLAEHRDSAMTDNELTDAVMALFGDKATTAALTLNDVMAVGARSRLVAERVVEFAKLRADGLSIHNARLQLGVSEPSAYRYERWMKAARDTAGLPPIAPRKNALTELRGEF